MPTAEGNASMTPQRHILLIGLRASGKSTIGAEVARRLGLPFVDLDDRTARLLGFDRPGPALVQRGERDFRTAESSALAKLLGEPPAVSALGGGTPTAPGAAALIEDARRNQRAFVVFLDPPLDVLAARLEKSPGDRPSLTGRGLVEEIGELASLRRPLYAALADLRLEAFGEAGEVGSLASIITSQVRNAS